MLLFRASTLVAAVHALSGGMWSQMKSFRRIVEHCDQLEKQVWLLFVPTQTRAVFDRIPFFECPDPRRVELYRADEYTAPRSGSAMGETAPISSCRVKPCDCRATSGPSPQNLDMNTPDMLTGPWLGFALYGSGTGLEESRSAASIQHIDCSRRGVVCPCA